MLNNAMFFSSFRLISFFFFSLRTASRFISHGIYQDRIPIIKLHLPPFPNPNKGSYSGMAHRKQIAQVSSIYFRPFIFFRRVLHCQDR
ncbi:hypothetical protein BGZ63DRAFT_392304 [Mariannaea sp. PMI_226]|nr:hypothetical protein BGZ63DRAFT_392304 [Mariannaea sp. PMI_226]